MIPRPIDYATLVFDCDGGVLDSNRIKTEAFRSAALPWGEAAAQALVDHHIGHGGVSRVAKFGHFMRLHPARPRPRARCRAATIRSGSTA